MSDRTLILFLLNLVQGKQILHNFVVNVCKAPTDWILKDIAEEFIKEVS